ncbi:protein kinase [Cryobacterium sp. PH31-L1]|uniref:protein kinase domain-containing protein n=1 Tax=Cryobacterium sp. PH31-L1 TaxID=3046199 RepID=UPI0024BAF957|nr:protein kinase [Cryobacterium sp. PH31-L1]MDJ0377657.1 protein kinase [Cryobacterium sp. PH31-L1]
MIRLLGTGDRAMVYLGHSGAANAVALKVFRADTASTSIELDIAVLTSAAAPGLVRLLDVAQLGDGRICLVLERLTGGSLARYLVEHPRLSPGEAVTLLAPIIVALGALHTAGFTHGAISQATILLDASGRAVVTGFGAVARLTDIPRERTGRLRADYERLAIVTEALVEAVAETDTHRESGAALLRRFRRAIDPAVSPISSDGAAGGAGGGSVLGTLEHDLFDWADAEPLDGFRFTQRLEVRAQNVHAGAFEAGTGQVTVEQLRRHELGGGTDHGSDHGFGGTFDDEFNDRIDGLFDGRSSPARFGVGSDALRSLTARGAALVRRLRPQARPRRSFSTVVDSVVDSHPLKAVAHALRKRLYGHHRPLLVAALGGASILVLALTLLPVSGRTGESAVPGASGADGTSRNRAGDTGTPAPVPTTPVPTTPVTTTPVPTTPVPTVADPADAARAAGAAAIAGDDPVSAVPALLVRRAACLVAASLVCLIDVDQTGSAILAADSYDARERQQGGSGHEVADYTPYLPSLAERSGDLAVVALTPASVQQKSQPASVLVVKGEGGWRLREIFDY